MILMKALTEMGHGDDIVLPDGKLPAASVAKTLIRLDGHGIPEILAAIFKLFPHDTQLALSVRLVAVSKNENIVPKFGKNMQKSFKTAMNC